MTCPILDLRVWNLYRSNGSYYRYTRHEMDTHRWFWNVSSPRAPYLWVDMFSLTSSAVRWLEKACYDSPTDNFLSLFLVKVLLHLRWFFSLIRISSFVESKSGLLWRTIGHGKSGISHLVKLQRLRCENLSVLTRMSTTQEHDPGLGFDPQEVLHEIAFVPSNRIESIELLRYANIPDCVLKEEKLPDGEEDIAAWLQKVR
jgi:hypothetical protein